MHTRVYAPSVMVLGCEGGLMIPQVAGVTLQWRARFDPARNANFTISLFLWARPLMLHKGMLKFHKTTPYARRVRRELLLDRAPIRWLPSQQRQQWHRPSAPSLGK